MDTMRFCSPYSPRNVGSAILSRWNVFVGARCHAFNFEGTGPVVRWLIYPNLNEGNV